MDLKTTLLAERTRILDELAAVEALLKARFGWEEKRLPATVEFSFETSSVGDDGPPQIPISYVDSAKEFLMQLNVGEEFTTVFFIAWLQKKMPNAKIIESSARGAFRSFVEDKTVSIVRHGAGRSPTVYRREDREDWV